MLEYEVDSKSIELFRTKYADYIVKELDGTILLKCILPHHEDNKRSAVLYTQRGVYFCPVCGYLFLDQILSSVEYSPRLYTTKVDTYIPMCWDFNKYPQHYMETGDNSYLWVNYQKDNVIGHGWRTATDTGRRMYGGKGKIGFRLESPVITESTTDAIRLLKLGVDCGSICSVSNWDNCEQGKVFIPQNDKAGIECAKKLSYKGVAIFKWFNYFNNVKDICDLSESDVRLLVEELK